MKVVGEVLEVKEVIPVEKIVLYLLYQFETIDCLDIQLILEYLSNYNNVNIINEKKYFDFHNLYSEIDGSIILDRNIILKKEYWNLPEYSNSDYGTIDNLISKIDMKYFLLKKIKILNGCSINMADKFNIFERNYLCFLLKYGYLIENNDKISISKYGEKYIFEKSYKKELLEFKNKLKLMRWRTDLLDKYLISTELEKDLKVILSLNSYMNYCEDIGVSCYTNNKKLLYLPESIS